MKLFISRKLEPESFIAETAKKKSWILTDIALIEHIPCETAKQPPLSDLIFFTSPTSVKLFLNAFGIPNSPVATMGTGTSKALPTAITPAFEGVGTSQEVARKFSAFAQNETVFFPIGDQSARTIQQALRPEQCIESIIYKTLPKPIALSEQDVYVFTSSSNVRSFLQTNLPIKNKTVIALGQRTANELQKSSIPSLLSKDYTPEGIIHTIFSIVGS